MLRIAMRCFAVTLQAPCYNNRYHTRARWWPEFLILASAVYCDRQNLLRQHPCPSEFHSEAGICSKTLPILNYQPRKGCQCQRNKREQRTAPPVSQLGVHWLASKWQDTANQTSHNRVRCDGRCGVASLGIDKVGLDRYQGED